MKTQWQNPRGIKERLLITADLVLVSPTHMGCGDTDSLLDMPLARDPLTGKALLAGASVAGALRSYLVKCGEADWAARLFGNIHQKIGYESLVIVDDAIGDIPGLEVRDGVAIDPSTRTAADKKKYDFELMPAGMEFKLSFELLIRDDDPVLLEFFVMALKGLETGEISLGKRKRRGFGECAVKNWQVWRFPWNTDGMLSWLGFDVTTSPTILKGKEIDQILLKKKIGSSSRDKRCVLNATFQLHSSMLIRSELGESTGEGYLPDQRHLHRKNHGREELIISGTSLAGALRSRARRICNTLGKDGYKITASLFGDSPVKTPGTKAPRATASRVWVSESDIKHPAIPVEMVQSRVSIDRFTGGALDSHLFSEQPVFGDGQTSITLRIEIENASGAEVGLLLLLLKDLCLVDLPLGGESGVGRGLLRGQTATLHFDQKSWEFAASGNSLLFTQGKAVDLQEYVDMFIGGAK